jgi:hypothetical protein
MEARVDVRARVGVDGRGTQEVNAVVKVDTR